MYSIQQCKYRKVVDGIITELYFRTVVGTLQNRYTSSVLIALLLKAYLSQRCRVLHVTANTPARRWHIHSVSWDLVSQCPF